MDEYTERIPDSRAHVRCMEDMIYRGVKMDADKRRKKDRRDLLKAAVIVSGVALVVLGLMILIRSITV